MPKKLTRIEVIDKANQVHGYKYIYDKMEYVNMSTKSCIICPEHGEFWQKPSSHIEGKGCPQCGRITKGKKLSDNKEKFIRKAQEVHGNKYDYSQVEYTNNHIHVKIICPIHGEFWQTPKKHLIGHGCPMCRNRNISIKKSMPFSEFHKKAIKVHGKKYEYDENTYRNTSEKIKIVCPTHGEFWQKPIKHLQGQGCPECAKAKRVETKVLGLDNFINKARIIHGDKYDYSEGTYIDYDTKIKIICPTHGEFWQSPDAHLQGCGCQKCAHVNSKSEDSINNYINQECHLTTITRDRSLIGERLECDIVIPSHNLAIEFNGLRWHSEQFNTDKNYHLHKTEVVESKGYHLIHIFEDEWLEHRNLVLDKIKHILGCDKDNIVVGARKCVLKSILKNEAESFLNTYHIQGFTPASVYYGAFYGDILVGVMSFKQEKEGVWNLTRFATNTEYRLPGLASKIFKWFIRDKNPFEVKTFLDRRWSYCNNNVYDKMGFRLEEILPPDYRYVVKNRRIHKFNFRKQVLAKKYNLPLSMTEKEMTQKLGFYRIWDCGLYKYVWKRGSD